MPAGIPDWGGFRATWADTGRAGRGGNTRGPVALRCLELHSVLKTRFLSGLGLGQVSVPKDITFCDECPHPALVASRAAGFDQVKSWGGGRDRRGRETA